MHVEAGIPVLVVVMRGEFERHLFEHGIGVGFGKRRQGWCQVILDADAGVVAVVLLENDAGHGHPVDLGREAEGSMVVEGQRDGVIEDPTVFVVGEHVDIDGRKDDFIGSDRNSAQCQLEFV